MDIVNGVDKQLSSPKFYSFLAINWWLYSINTISAQYKTSGKTEADNREFYGGPEVQHMKRKCNVTLMLQMLTYLEVASSCKVFPLSFLKFGFSSNS